MSKKEQRITLIICATLTQQKYHLASKHFQVTETDQFMLRILLHRVLLRLLCRVFKSTFTQSRTVWLSRCLSSLLVQTIWPPSKGKLKKTQHVGRKEEGIGLQAFPWLHLQLLLFKGFLVEHRMQQTPQHMLAGPPCFSFHLICLFLQKDQQYYGKEHQENRRKLNSILLQNTLVKEESICATVF